MEVAAVDAEAGGGDEAVEDIALFGEGLAEVVEGVALGVVEEGGEDAVDDHRADGHVHFGFEVAAELDGLVDGHLFGEGDEVDNTTARILKKIDHLRDLAVHEAAADGVADHEGDLKQVDAVAGGGGVDDDAVPCGAAMTVAFAFVIEGFSEEEELVEAGDDAQEFLDQLVLKNHIIRHLAPQDEHHILAHRGLG